MQEKPKLFTTPLNMAASGTSFHRKKGGKFAPISGTRKSLHNNQLLLSTGIPSLDNCFGTK